MSTFNTNVFLSDNIAYGEGDTIYTTNQTLSVSNFELVPQLSATYTTNFEPGDDIDEAEYTLISTAMPTASAGQTVLSIGAFFDDSTAGVTHVNFISAGTIEGKAVKYLAFNKFDDDLDNLLSTTTTLSVFDGVKFQVNDAYDGEDMMFILENRSGIPFTVNISSGESTEQTVSDSTIFANTPELRRLNVLGYI